MEAKLIVIRGKANKGEVALNLPTTIGRSRESDLTVAHPMVSRSHCEIFEADGVLKVRDLGSLNGTFINGERVTEAELPPNAEITVGPLTFRAEYQHGDDDLPAFDEVGEAVAFEALEGPTEESTEPADAEQPAGPETAELDPDFTVFEEAIADDAPPTENKKAHKKAPAPKVEIDDEDEAEAEISSRDDDDFDVEPEPKRPAPKKPAPKKPADDDLVEMEDLEETAAFNVDMTESDVSDEEQEEEPTPKRKPSRKAAKKVEDDEVAEAEEEEASDEPGKKKGWWPFKRGAAEADKKSAKKEPSKKEPAKKAPAKKVVEEEDEVEEEEAPPPPKKPAKKEPVKPAKPAKKGGKLDLDDLALAAVQGDDDDGGDKPVSQAEEEDLDDFLKGLQ